MIQLSIVIPVYNGGGYISQCLANLTRQSFRDWEAIFVDDGSTDDTGEALDRLISPRENCRVIHKANGGTARARNAGMELARGKYIAFLDVDDELDPQMYEALVRMMEESGADLGICGYYFKVEGDGAAPYLEEKSYPSGVLRGRDAIRANLLELWDRDMLHNVWNKLYRMDLLRAQGLRYRDGQAYTEDRFFNRAYIERCDSIALTERCLYYYVRERAGSTSERYREDYFAIRHREYVEFQAHFRRMGVWDERAREYVSREFIERVAGCVENIFHAEGALTEKEKRRRIARILADPDVVEAGRSARCRSKMMRLLILPLRLRCTWGTYGLYKLVYLIRRSNPVLFHRLKSRR